MAKTYYELLEESLPPRAHKMYKIWRQYSLDAINRGQGVRKIISKFTCVDRVSVLDVGCGEGGISIAFGKEGKTEVYAFDIDHKSVKRSKIRAREEKAAIDFLIADGLNLPFKSGTFNIVVCNDVIEHVPKPQQLVNEAYRNLKDGGFLYVSAPNGISPYSIIHDPHYGLVGVSLMPYRIGRYYVRKIRKVSEEYNVYTTFSYWPLKEILRCRFTIVECHREHYSGKVEGPLQILVRHLPNIIARFAVPTFIFLCEKIQ
jgi:2-polyprenyl-3-methyl-5-hydroxy-6-metoxy-1,4-benzoquinol methylase